MGATLGTARGSGEQPDQGSPSQLPQQESGRPHQQPQKRNPIDQQCQQDEHKHVEGPAARQHDPPTLQNDSAPSATPSYEPRPTAGPNPHQSVAGTSSAAATTTALTAVAAAARSPRAASSVAVVSPPQPRPCSDISPPTSGIHATPHAQTHTHPHQDATHRFFQPGPTAGGGSLQRLTGASSAAATSFAPATVPAAAHSPQAASSMPQPRPSSGTSLPANHTHTHAHTHTQQDPTHRFFQLAEVMWPYLGGRSRQAVRASCTSGRLLHDRMWCHVSVRLGPDQADLSCAHIYRALANARGRGARPKSLVLWGYGGRALEETHEHQFAAALGALSDAGSVAGLTLDGGIPCSLRLAAAVAGLGPSLRDLTLHFTFPQGQEDPLANRPPGHADAYVFGLTHMLACCAPRLHSLALCHVEALPAVCWQGLALASQLTQLTVLGVPHEIAGEASLMQAVSRVPSLRSLTLRNDAVRDPHPAPLLPLACLTGLTELVLELPHCCRADGRWSEWVRVEEEGTDALVMRAVWDAEERALADVLACMPRLQVLVLSQYMSLPASCLSSLTALTHLAVGSLSQPRPRAEGGAAAALDAAAAAAAAAAMGHVQQLHMQQQQQQQLWQAQMMQMQQEVAAAAAALPGAPLDLDAGGLGPGAAAAGALNAPPPPPPPPPPLMVPGVPAAGGGANAAAAGAPQGPVAAMAAAAAAAVEQAAARPLPPSSQTHVALPAGLKTLRFLAPVSPRILASLLPSLLPELCPQPNPPRALAPHASSCKITFSPPRGGLHAHHSDPDHLTPSRPPTFELLIGPNDVTHTNRLLPSVADTFRAAGQLLADPRVSAQPRVVSVTADSGPGALRAPLEAADGHMSWIGQLSPLGRQVEDLSLHGVSLGSQDVLGLVETLPCIQRLQLHRSLVPLASLPALALLPSLEHLSLSLEHCVSPETLESGLLLLGTQAPALRTVGLVRAPAWVEVTLASVRRALAARGKDRVELVLRQAWDDDDDDGDEEEEEEQEEEEEEEDAEEEQQDGEEEQEGGQGDGGDGEGNGGGGDGAAGAEGGGGGQVGPGGVEGGGGGAGVGGAGGLMAPWLLGGQVIWNML